MTASLDLMKSDNSSINSPMRAIYPAGENMTLVFTKTSDTSYRIRFGGTIDGKPVHEARLMRALMKGNSTMLVRTLALSIGFSLLAGAWVTASPTPVPGGANQVSALSGTIGQTIFNGVLRIKVVELRDATPADHPKKTPGRKPESHGYDGPAAERGA